MRSYVCGNMCTPAVRYAGINARVIPRASAATPRATCAFAARHVNSQSEAASRIGSGWPRKRHARREKKTEGGDDTVKVETRVSSSSIKMPLAKTCRGHAPPRKAVFRWGTRSPLLRRAWSCPLLNRARSRFTIHAFVSYPKSRLTSLKKKITKNNLILDY